MAVQARRARRVQVRIGVGAQGDSKHVQPQVRESSQQVWWGEISWLPSTFPSPMCQDTSITSLESPGTMWVRRHPFPNARCGAGLRPTECACCCG